MSTESSNKTFDWDRFKHFLRICRYYIFCYCHIVETTVGLRLFARAIACSKRALLTTFFQSNCQILMIRLSSATLVHTFMVLEGSVSLSVSEASSLKPVDLR